MARPRGNGRPSHEVWKAGRIIRYWRESKREWVAQIDGDKTQYRAPTSFLVVAAALEALKNKGDGQ